MSKKEEFGNFLWEQEGYKRDFHSYAKYTNQKCTKCEALTGTTVNDIALCDICITDFFYVLMKFKTDSWILVFAGTEEQFDAFRRWVRRTRIVLNAKYIFVRNPETIAGARDYVFVRYGTYFKRPDFEAIEQIHRGNLATSG